MWMSFKAEQGNRDEEAQRKWGSRNYIQIKAMKEMSYLVDEIKDRLENLGLKESQGPMRVNWTQKEQAIILKIIIAGAFYPHYFVKTNTGLMAERQAYADLGCRDPFSTIYFRGFETKYFAPLYQKRVKQLLAEAAPPERMKVSADQGCQKIYVTFKSYENNVDTGVAENDVRKSYVPGRIVPEVYWALKLRQAEFRPELNVLP
jgi:ATP-dependent RNA helicase TDRD9